MKTYLNAYAMCRGMFCAIPSPWRAWDEKARGKMLLFLPLVGLEIGLIWALTAWLCRLLQLPAAAEAVVLCAYPYLLSGFMHLDGFMDVTDAVKSWREPERRREILKDPHTGSFAVIAVVLLILAQFAMFASADGDADIVILVFIPVISRCCSALAVSGLRPMSTSQYAGMESARAHLAIPAAAAALAIAAAVLLCGKYALALAGCMAGYGLALLRAYRSLDGMNGDISGYALSIGELCAVAVYALI